MQSSTPKIIIAIAVTAIIVGGGVYFWQNKNNTQIIQQTTEVNSNSSPAPAQKTVQSSPVAPQVTNPDWQIFRNSALGIQLQYPKSLGQPATGKDIIAELYGKDNVTSLINVRSTNKVTPDGVYKVSIFLNSANFNDTYVKKAQSLLDPLQFTQKVKDFLSTQPVNYNCAGLIHLYDECQIISVNGVKGAKLQNLVSELYGGSSRVYYVFYVNNSTPCYFLHTILKQDFVILWRK